MKEIKDDLDNFDPLSYIKDVIKRFFLLKIQSYFNNNLELKEIGKKMLLQLDVKNMAIGVRL